MKFDVLGLLAACSYALDCVEAELIKVTNNHSKRVAYMAVCTAEKNIAFIQTAPARVKACRIWQSVHCCTTMQWHNIFRKSFKMTLYVTG